MTLTLQVAALSHVGLLRSLNEDSGYGGPRLLAIADGMGGHAAGEVASAVAIESLTGLDSARQHDDHEHDDRQHDGDGLLTALRTAATSANDQLREMVLANAALDGMGTTLTALLFEDDRIGLLHVGDSRCYLLRDGELTQLTRDDTLVQTLVDEGRITADEATTHPQRNLITNALDGRPDVEFDLTLREAVAGDRYLLCSDGLTGPVGDLDTLREALADPDPVFATQRLVELALRGGGPDNVTVVIADVIDDVIAGDQAAPPAPVLVGAAAEPVDDSDATDLDAGPAGRAAEVIAAVDLPAPPIPGRRLLPRVAAWVLAVVVLLAAAGFGGYTFLRSQWYVGVDQGEVTIFRGAPGSIAGLRLHWVDTRTGLSGADLPAQRRSLVEAGIDANGRTDAERIVASLQADVAASQITSPTPTPTPTPITSLSPEPTPT